MNETRQESPRKNLKRPRPLGHGGLPLGHGGLPLGHGGLPMSLPAVHLRSSSELWLPKVKVPSLGRSRNPGCAAASTDGSLLIPLPPPCSPQPEDLSDDGSGEDDREQLQPAFAAEMVVRSSRVCASKLPRLNVEVVVRHRALLDTVGQLQLVPERKLVLSEEPPPTPISPLHVYLSRKIRDQERAMLPCMEESFHRGNLDKRHGVEEPLRDRDKDWRELLWTDITPNLGARAQAALSVGKVDGELSATEENTQESDKVFLDGVLMRKKLMLRQAFMVGKVNLIVTVYGMGIAGTVFIRGNKIPRHVQIEGYSPVDGMTYDLRVDLADMERLCGISGLSELLQPGRKRELCTALVRMLSLDEVPDGGLELRITPGVKESAATLRLRRRVDERRRKEERAAYLATQPPPPPPPPRKKGLVYCTAANVSSFFVTVSFFNYLSRRATYFVRVYDPGTCQVYELPVGVRELASFVGETMDPELWDGNMRQSVCERLVPKLRLKTWGNQTAVVIGRRIGVAGPAIRRDIKGRRRAAVDDALDAAKVVARLKGRVNSSSKLTHVAGRRGQLIQNKVARRDISRGERVAAGAERVWSKLYIFSLYLKCRQYTLRLFEVERSMSSELHFMDDDIIGMVKGEPELLERGSGNALCRHILRERATFNPTHGWNISTGMECGLPEIGTTIYRNGHKLADMRQKVPVGTEPPFIFCIVRALLHFRTFTFEAYDPITRRVFVCNISKAMSVEMCNEYRDLDLIERDVQLAVNIGMMCVMVDEYGVDVLSFAAEEDSEEEEAYDDDLYIDSDDDGDNK